MYSSPDELLVRAASSGNLALLRAQVAAGGCINYWDPIRGNALVAAIRRADLPMLEWLIRNGAEVNADYGDARGPLEIALRSPNAAIVRTLVFAGARLKRTARPFYRQRLEQCLREATGEDT